MYTSKNHMYWVSKLLCNPLSHKSSLLTLLYSYMCIYNIAFQGHTTLLTVSWGAWKTCQDQPHLRMRRSTDFNWNSVRSCWSRSFHSIFLTQANQPICQPTICWLLHTPIKLCLWTHKRMKSENWRESGQLTVLWFYWQQTADIQQNTLDPPDRLLGKFSLDIKKRKSCYLKYTIHNNSMKQLDKLLTLQQPWPMTFQTLNILVDLLTSKCQWLKKTQNNYTSCVQKIW